MTITIDAKELLEISKWTVTVTDNEEVRSQQKRLSRIFKRYEKEIKKAIKEEAAIESDFDIAEKSREFGYHFQELATLFLGLAVYDQNHVEHAVELLRRIHSIKETKTKLTLIKGGRS